MFDFVRNHTRLVLGFMLLLIIPSFVFFGIDGYTKFTSGDNTTVAKVDGITITRAELEQAHQRAIDRVRRESPGQDVGNLDTPELRRATLDRLVRERVLLAASNKMHLMPSDARLRRLFLTDPQFANIRNPDGSVNRDLLAYQGMTSEMFAQQLRQDIGAQQVLVGLARSSLAPPTIASAALDPLLQRREVQLQRFDPAAYRARIVPTEAEIDDYYKAHTASYRAPEQAQIEYVMLDLATLGKGLTVSDDELRKFYADNAKRYTQPEERRVSHVLIQVDKDAPAADKAKAKARAEALLAEVRKAPGTFADVARKNSQDSATAPNGGDLDYFGRGAMVPTFDEVAFKIKPGEISDVFETDFGYHFLTVTAVRGGQTKPFDSVRAEIEAELRTAKAKAEWPKAAEQFTNMVYEQYDSLQPAVEKFKLEKQTATVPRTPAPGATGPLASAKLLDAVFSAESVTNKRNTDAVEVGTNQLVSARVLKHSPSRTQTLDEVKDRVREQLVGARAAELARQDGLAKLAALKQSPAESLPTTLTLSRNQAQGAPRDLIERVMAADAAKLPVPVGVDLGDQGYVVLRVVKVLPREAAPGGDDALRAQYAQAWAAAESDAYLGALKQRFKATVDTSVALSTDKPETPAR
jgi:peptidyl-prolyl cis-trans isomerase D